MSDSDDRQNRAVNIPPGDLGRRRVAEILRRERPRNEQEDAHWNALNLIVQIMKEGHATGGLLNAFTPRRVLAHGCFPRGNGNCIVLFNHKLRKGRGFMAANFQSKFFRQPPAN